MENYGERVDKGGDSICAQVWRGGEGRVLLKEKSQYRCRGLMGCYMFMQKSFEPFPHPSYVSSPPPLKNIVSSRRKRQ